MKLLALVIVLSMEIAAVASELQHLTIENPKEKMHVALVVSGKEVIAEIKLTKPGVIDLEGESISTSMRGNGAEFYTCKGRSKLELSVDGKPLLKVSGDSISIQELRTTGSGK